jgi:hypothetical protein
VCFALFTLISVSLVSESAIVRVILGFEVAGIASKIRSFFGEFRSHVRRYSAAAAFSFHGGSYSAIAYGRRWKISSNGW